jgi:hypothetical protein
MTCYSKPETDLDPRASAGRLHLATSLNPSIGFTAMVKTAPTTR